VISFWIIVALLVVFSVCNLAFTKGRNDGWKAGHRKGFELGWKDGDNWWIGVEESATEAREELWREELEKGREP